MDIVAGILFAGVVIMLMIVDFSSEDGGL